MGGRGENLVSVGKAESEERGREEGSGDAHGLDTNGQRSNISRCSPLSMPSRSPSSTARPVRRSTVDDVPPPLHRDGTI